MKKILTLFTLLCVTGMSVTNLQAQTVSACLHDLYDYHYEFTMTVTGASYSGKGTVDLNGGWLWKGKIKGTSLKNTKITATNTQANGCTSGWVDYFVYEGNATAGLFYGSEFRYDGSGTWTNYCNGSINSTGSWWAQDCYHYPIVALKASKDGPGRSAATVSSLKVSPNPVNSQATISYSVAKSGSVRITVYNSMQQAVKVLVNDFKNAGTYSMVWDTKTANINSGIYRVVAVIDGNTTSTTVQVIK